jgi:putative transcriptional regulator
MIRANVSNFKNQRAKASNFTTLNALCRILQCQLGDILEYREDYYLGKEK